MGITSPRRTRRGCPLAVEQLEHRWVPSTLQAISVSANVQPPSDTAAGGSDSPSVSADGRYVAFESKAPNLVPGQTGVPGVDNIFLLDRSSGKITLVSHDPRSPTATPGSGYPSYSPLISRDGRFILFGSEAPEFAPGGLTPFGHVAVLYDVATGQNVLLSHASDSLTTAAAGPNGASARSDPDAVSSDGHYVLFMSDGTDLVPGQGSSTADDTTQLFLYDTTTQTTQLVSHALDQSTVTGDGGVDAAFISDRGPVDYGKVGTASVADNGLVAYVDKADNLVGGNPGQFEAYLYDPTTQLNQLISFDPGDPTQGAGASSLSAVISADGSVVAYLSPDHVVAGQTGPQVDNVFLYSRPANTNTLVSAAAGLPAQGGDHNSGGGGLSLTLSDDGRYLAFTSEATDLVPGQVPTPGDNVFLYDAQAQTLSLLSGVNGSTTAGAGGVPDLTPSDTPTGPPTPTGPGDPITGAEFPGGPQVLSMSKDGGLVAFVSSAGNLVSGQTGAAPTFNVFLYSRAAGTTTLVSGLGGSATAAGARESSFPALSADGNLLAFHSLATDLVPGLFDGNGVADLFTATPGTPGVTLVSAAAFHPQAPGDSFSTSVSADGRYTVFTSNATNLVANQVTVNSQQNVFLFDRQTGTVALVNHAPGTPNTTGDGGVQPEFLPSADTGTPPPDYVRPVISADGSTVAFTSFDDNLVPGEVVPRPEIDQNGNAGPVIEFVYLYDVATGTVALVNHAPGKPATVQTPIANSVYYDALQPAVNADGSYVAFAFGLPGGDEVGVALYSRALDSTTLVDSYPDQYPTITRRDPGISDDGRFVAYDSGDRATQISVYDRVTGTRTLVSHAFGSTAPALGDSSVPVISPDGSTIAFVSAAGNLVDPPTGSGSGPTNVFRYDVATGVVSLVSAAAGSTAAGGDANSDSPAVNEDGSYVAFRSDADNLVPGQSGATGNVFEFNAKAGTRTLVSHTSGDPAAGAGGSSDPVVDDDGHLISYVSTAGDLIPGQGGPANVRNAFVWMRPTNANILASGQGGSPTVGGNEDSDGPLLTRDSFPGFSSRATNLVQGVGGTSVAYINTLVAVALSANTIAPGSPVGSVVGNLVITSLLPGQYVPPTYVLPRGAASNPFFTLVAAGGNESLRTAFQAGSAGQQTYQVLVNVDIGFGSDPIVLTAFGPAPAPPPPPSPAGPRGVRASLVAVRVGKKRTRLVVEVFDLATGAEHEPFPSPFQMPAFRNIRVSVRPDGAGVPDLVVVTARKGKRTVTQTFAQ